MNTKVTVLVLSKYNTLIVKGIIIIFVPSTYIPVQFSTTIYSTCITVSIAIRIFKL